MAFVFLRRLRDAQENVLTTRHVDGTRKPIVLVRYADASQRFVAKCVESDVEKLRGHDGELEVDEVKNHRAAYETGDGHRHVVGVEFAGTIGVNDVLITHAAMGDLLTVLQTRQNDVNTLSRYSWEIACAIHHVHACDIAHRDLKLENVLVMENGTVRLADFGAATLGRETSRQKWGTRLYAAPEIMVEAVDGCVPVYLTKPVDCWSYGIIVHILMTLRAPWTATNTMEYDESKPGTEAWRKLELCEDVLHVLQGLLHDDPKSRWKIEDALDSPWLVDQSRQFKALL